MFAADKKARWLLLLAAGVWLVSFALSARRDEAIIYAAGLVAAAALLALAWRRTPRYLLFALLLYLPFEDGILTYFPHHVTVPRVVPDGLILLVFLYRGWRALRRKERLFGTPMDFPVAMLIVVAIVSMVFNHIPPTQAVQGPYVMFRYAMVFYLAARSKYTVEEVQTFLRWLIGVAMVECGLVVAQLVLLATTPVQLFGYQLPQGTMGHPNILGAYLAVVSIIALAMLSDTWTTHVRGKLFAILLLTSLAIMLAISRQSMAALVVGAAAVVVLSHWKTPVADVGYAAISVIAGTLGGYVITKSGVQILNQVVTKVLHVGGTASSTSSTSNPTPAPTGTDLAQLQQHLNVKAEQSVTYGIFSTDFYHNSRLYEIVHGGLAVLRQSPLFGMGPGTFGARATFHDLAFYQKLDVGLLLSDPNATYVADVEWMTVLGQLGLLGLIGFLWVFFAVGRIGYTVWRKSAEELTQRLGLACMAFVPAFAVLAWFGPNLEIRQVSIFLWFIPGLALGLFTREQEARESRPATPAPATTGWLMTDSTLARIKAIGKDTFAHPHQPALGQSMQVEDAAQGATLVNMPRQEKQGE